jgi:hypothetical protein
MSSYPIEMGVRSFFLRAAGQLCASAFGTANHPIQPAAGRAQGQGMIPGFLLSHQEKMNREALAAFCGLSKIETLCFAPTVAP